MTDHRRKELKRSPVFWALSYVVLIWAVPMLALGLWVIASFLRIAVLTLIYPDYGMDWSLFLATSAAPAGQAVLAIISLLGFAACAMYGMKRQYSAAKRSLLFALSVMILTAFTAPGFDMAVRQSLLNMLPAFTVMAGLAFYFQKYSKAESRI